MTLVNQQLMSDCLVLTLRVVVVIVGYFVVEIVQLPVSQDVDK